MKILRLVVGMVQTNCYIFYDENTMEGAVVDPGDNAPSILKAIEDEKIQLKYVLLTHGHFDHILAVHDVAKATGAKLVCPKGDTWLLHKDAMGEFRPWAKSFVETPVDIEAEEGTEVTIGGLTAYYMNTPGHTPGSSVIKVGDVLFTGDTLFRHECGRCDLEGGDFSKMLASLKRLHDLEGDYKVLPGHEGLSTLEDERRNNPYMRQATGK
ncbi:MAG: MBL fold metallo-hydrolase [Butyricicoccus sp.]|nr:MBL fold metallo-hydrolase [Butyricicoccus sp.]